MGRNNITIQKHYDGAHVWLRCVFSNSSHLLEDPATISIEILFPDATTQTVTKASMEQWVEPDDTDNTGHWQYKHLNAQTGFHKFTVTFVMANGDSGVAIGRWKVI